VKVRDEYPENRAVKVWEKDGLVFSIVLQPGGYYCGYVRFPKRPVLERGYEGILTYVPVHGGITYAEQSPDGSMVYGFDCSHVDDWTIHSPKGKFWTIREVKEEAEKMAIGIKVVAKYELEYLTASTEEERAKVIDRYHRELREKYGIMFNLRDNFGAMLNVLAGTL